MLNRRQLLRAGGALALATPFSGFGSTLARATEVPLFRFGVVADPQYAPIAPVRTRYYSNSLWKLSEAIATFNVEKLEFVVTLGDIIDRDWGSYAHVLPLYEQLEHPNFFLLGNHDFEVASEYLGGVLRTVGLQRAYYDFVGGGHRFIVIDGNEVSLFANAEGSENHAAAQKRIADMTAAGLGHAHPWNGGISDEQFAWVEETMNKAKAAGERVIVMGHYPIYPVNYHNLWDDARLVDLLTSYDNFLLYINGHNHAGNYGSIGRRHFVNFKGMVETPDTTAYSIVEVHEDRVEIRAFGVEEPRSLLL
ncbi:MAG: metallophosphoesterase [Rhizobiaceae bacterium]|nr:metallophosphoesterase [Rhizobiaceae bacterium]MCV0405246.1 metallophosphoesterase [Rhizobiaceae bacterium]